MACMSGSYQNDYHAIKVPIDFKLIEQFLKEFKKETEKIREKNEFCEGIFFVVDMEEHFWRITKKTRKTLGVLELDEDEISPDMIEQANQIKIPGISFMIIFNPHLHRTEEEFEKAQKKIEQNLPAMIKIAEGIMQEITKA